VTTMNGSPSATAKFREACIRCSFLQIDPCQAHRLAYIQADINGRITAARDNGWLGDVEQLQLTLGHLTDKQAKIRHLLDTLNTAPLITAAPTLTTNYFDLKK
jgi:hypothetical protein